MNADWQPLVPVSEVNGNSLNTFPVEKSPTCTHVRLTLHPDGGVAPCCVVYKESSDFGHLPFDTMSLWNNDYYQSARALFSARTVPTRKATICDGCEIFQRHPSKEVAR